MGCCWGQDQGRHSGAPSLSSAPVQSPSQDSVVVHDAVWCTPLGVRWMAGILGMRADPPPPSHIHMCPGPVFLPGIAAGCWGGRGQTVALPGQRAWQQG